MFFRYFKDYCEISVQQFKKNCLRVFLTLAGFFQACRTLTFRRIFKWSWRNLQGKVDSEGNNFLLLLAVTDLVLWWKVMLESSSFSLPSVFEEIPHGPSVLLLLQVLKHFYNILACPSHSFVCKLSGRQMTKTNRTINPWKRKHSSTESQRKTNKLELLFSPKTTVPVKSDNGDKKSPSSPIMWLVNAIDQLSREWNG